MNRCSHDVHRRGEDMHAPSKVLMLATTVHMVVVALPSAALAQTYHSTPTPTAPSSSGSDTIATKNGGMLRGTIIEALPDVQARILLATGEIVVIPWAQIERIEHAPSPPVPVERPALMPSEVWVHFEAPEGVVLQQDRTSRDDWQTVCSAPCDTLLPMAFYYRAAGGGIKASDDFALKGSPGARETVVVDGASRTASVLGVLVLVAGGIADFVGLAMTVASTVDGEGWRVAAPGLVALGVGTVAIVGGYVLAHKATRVDQKLGGSPTGQLLPGPGIQGPIWNTALTEPKNLPPIVGIPVFSGRF
jgi:hypothetical protein